MFWLVVHSKFTMVAGGKHQRKGDRKPSKATNPKKPTHGAKAKSKIHKKQTPKAEYSPAPKSDRSKPAEERKKRPDGEIKKTRDTVKANKRKGGDESVEIAGDSKKTKPGNKTGKVEKYKPKPNRELVMIKCENNMAA